LTYPPQATLLEQPTLDWNFDSAWEENRITLTTSGLAEDADLILTARFAPNSLTQTTPQWHTPGTSRCGCRAGIACGSMAGVLRGFGSLGLFTYARANGRELTTSPVISNPNPPSNVPPAVIGKLTGQMHGFMGTIFDLAQRGVLEVSEEKGFWGSKNHVLILKDKNVSLRPHEQGLLDAIFKTGEIQVNMNEVAARLASKSKLFDEPLEQELIQRGWLDPERKSKRTMLTASGIIMMFVAFALFIASLIGINAVGDLNLVMLIAALAGIGIGMFIVSIGLLIHAAAFSILTPSGEEQTARWKGFAEYLKQVSKGREPAIRPDYFERYLAYAAVFGLGTKWAQYFQTLGGVPLPIWFHATAGSNGDFGAIVAVMSSSDSAGVSAGSGGGAGASGGGSSGAG
jgi:uncharacterized protein (TIGR04222 family)